MLHMDENLKMYWHSAKFGGSLQVYLMVIEETIRQTNLFCVLYQGKYIPTLLM